MASSSVRHLRAAVRVLLLAAGVLVILLGLVLAGPGSLASTSASPDPATAPLPPPSSFIQVDRERIQAHLKAVETSLRARDVSHLPRRVQAARAMHLDRLRAYRLAGEFPLNVDRPGEKVPVFRDHREVLCAVGHLLALDGQGEVVDRIAAHRNLARIPELADEPGLLEWLQGAGLTVEEAAQIQPAYNGWPGPAPDPAADPGLSRGYVAASLASGLAGAFTAGWSLAGIQSERPPAQLPGIGALTGAATILLGATHLGHEDRATRYLAAGNVLAGALSLGASVHAHRQIQLRLQPQVVREEDPAGGEGTRVGVSGSIRF